MKTIAQRLKWARDQKEWTQSHLAVAAEVSTGTIGNIESGQRQSKGSLPQIAEALGVHHKWLAYGTGPIWLSDEPPASDRLTMQVSQLTALLLAIPEDQRDQAYMAAVKELIAHLPKSPPPPSV